MSSRNGGSRPSVPVTHPPALLIICLAYAKIRLRELKRKTVRAKDFVPKRGICIICELRAYSSYIGIYETEVRLLVIALWQCAKTVTGS